MDTNAPRFDNRLLTALPGDPESGPRRREVRGAAWSSVMPTPVAAPRLLAWSPEVAALLGFAPADVQDDDFAQVFGGNALYAGMQPWAANYGGHQFGHWAGQLGDGRAISLGELVAADGRHWELQLKGAGPTPYSRGADGRAVLRSSIREFLCSEAMHHLGVPTTRALSLVGTGEDVVRDMFYDGHPRAEPGAIVCDEADAHPVRDHLGGPHCDLREPRAVTRLALPFNLGEVARDAGIDQLLQQRGFTTRRRQFERTEAQERGRPTPPMLRGGATASARSRRWRTGTSTGWRRRCRRCLPTWRRCRRGWPRSSPP